MGRTVERLSQRVLVYELRLAIDRALRRPHDTRAVRLALSLIEEHPRGMASAHVRHNLGPERLAWVGARTSAPPSHVPPTQRTVVGDDVVAEVPAQPQG